MIGQGGFAKVYEVRVREDPEIVRAVKIISKENLTEDDYFYVLSEMEILTQVDHPNIVRLIEIFDDDNSLYLVFELMKGGDVSFCSYLSRNLPLMLIKSPCNSISESNS